MPSRGVRALLVVFTGAGDDDRGDCMDGSCFVEKGGGDCDRGDATNGNCFVGGAGETDRGDAINGSCFTGAAELGCGDAIAGNFLAP